MTFELKNEKEFEFYAARNYLNKQCLDVKDFENDLESFKYIKRLFRRYRDHGELRERLILNHLISIYNVWPIRPANHMIFYKIEPEFWSALKTFLIFLNYIPENEYQDIGIDINIANLLRKI